MTLMDRVQEVIGSPDDVVIHREGISYAPGMTVSKGASGKPIVLTGFHDRSAYLAAPELNPSHLDAQGIQSRIDTSGRNIIYKLGDGEVSVGFYDRRRIEEARQRDTNNGAETLALLLANTDELLPKLELVERQLDAETLKGKNFPGMFTYRGVVFPGSTTYGVMVAVDESLLGKKETISDVILDEEFVREHTSELNYLLPLLAEAGRSQGIALSELDLNKYVDLGEGASMIALHSYFSASGYTVTVCYTREPLLAVVVRANGVPLLLSADEKSGKPELREILAGGFHQVEGRRIATITQAVVQNAGNPDDSIVGDLMYEAISRRESIREAKGNKDFGLLDVMVMRGFRVTDFSATFTKKEDSILLPSLSEPSTVMGDGMKGGSYGGGYTAGRSSVRNVRTASVRTEQHFGVEKVLLRDVLCLVHRDRTPTAYSPHPTLEGPAS